MGRWLTGGNGGGGLSCRRLSLRVRPQAEGVWAWRRRPSRPPWSAATSSAPGEILADDVWPSAARRSSSTCAGKAATLVLLKAVSSVFQDFRYVRSFVEEHAMGLALVFEARIGSRTIEGVDFLRLNSLGLVDDFRVMVRPHSALEALMEAMMPAIERVLAEQS